jgi:toxin FitB
MVKWLSDVDEDQTFLSVVTLAEVRYGVERLQKGVRRRKIEAWLQGDLLLRFEDRILPVNEKIAHAWGEVVAHCETRGRPIGAMDALIAATVRVHDLILVTRNTSDFGVVVDETGRP